MSEVFKFLAIKNWHRYQPDNRLRNKSVRLVWIRDYVDRDDDYDFQSLTIFQRGVFCGILRIAGTTPSRLVHNDVTYIARTMHAIGTDRPHIGHAVATLISRGLVIPTNDENFYTSIAAKCGGEGEGECAQTTGGQIERGSAADGRLIITPPRDSAGEVVPIDQENPTPSGFNIPEDGA